MPCPVYPVVLWAVASLIWLLRMIIGPLVTGKYCHVASCFRVGGGKGQTCLQNCFQKSHHCALALCWRLLVGTLTCVSKWCGLGAPPSGGFLSSLARLLEHAWSLPLYVFVSTLAFQHFPSLAPRAALTAWSPLILSSLLGQACLWPGRVPSPCYPLQDPAPCRLTRPLWGRWTAQLGCAEPLPHLGGREGRHGQFRRGPCGRDLQGDRLLVSLRESGKILHLEERQCASPNPAKPGSHIGPTDL